MMFDRMGLFDAVSALKRHALDSGATRVEISYSIHDFERAIKTAGKGELGEHFKRSLHTLPPNMVCWIGAFDADGAAIAVVGARRDIVSGWTLQKHIRESWERTYRAEDGDPVKLQDDSCAYASAIEGDFVYIGDGWVTEAARGKNLLATIQKALILSVFDEWRPSLVYGWMRPILVARGLSIAWGYSIAHRKGISWIRPPAQKDLEELYFVACDQHGIRSLIRDPIS